jgi:hypothetical protein
MKNKIKLDRKNRKRFSQYVLQRFGEHILQQTATFQKKIDQV